MFLSATLSFFAALCSALAAYPISSPNHQNRTTVASKLMSALVTLNATVGGRLHASVPLDKPCFSIYEGRHVPVDPVACATVQSNYTNPAFRLEHFSAYMLLQSETCQASHVPDQCVLDYTSPSDTEAYTGVDCRLGNIPSYYIEVANAADVQAALRFSNDTGVRLSVKNKGHDYKGRSSGKGTLALWTTGMNSMSHDAAFQPEGCSTTYDAVTVGAGVLTEDIYRFADQVNRTVIGGYHQTIGFAGGFALGGGHSILTPVFGLAVDRVVQVKVVTPDGVYRTANECQHPDLFFALRGGGGSAFGVVTESSHRTEPRMPIQTAALSFTAANKTDLAEWYALTVNYSFQWANEGWGGHIPGAGLIHVNPLLSNAQANESMKAAADFVRARGGSAVVEELPSWWAFFDKYVLSAEAGVGNEVATGSRLIPSEFFSTESGRARLSALVAETLPFASPYVRAGTPWLFKGEPGATSVTPAWRDAIWHLGLSVPIPYNATLAQREEIYRTMGEHNQRFRDLTPGSGAYFNEGYVYEPDHEVSFWGDNYSKLLEIKKKYDPNGLLDCWQCVGWKGASDPLYQCYIKL
ncbi:hypothetical protein ACG7TL_001236 [Trametes sanguinea]